MGFAKIQATQSGIEQTGRMLARSGATLKSQHSYKMCACSLPDRVLCGFLSALARIRLLVTPKCIRQPPTQRNLYMHYTCHPKPM